MRVDCSSNRSTCTDGLLENIKALGLMPIVTPHVVRVVYDGPKNSLGESIIDLFEKEPDHDIVCDRPQSKKTKKK